MGSRWQWTQFLGLRSILPQLGLELNKGAKLGFFRYFLMELQLYAFFGTITKILEVAELSFAFLGCRTILDGMKAFVYLLPYPA